MLSHFYRHVFSQDIVLEAQAQGWGLCGFVFVVPKIFLFVFLKNYFIYLARPGLSCSSLGDLYILAYGSSSQTRDQTQAPLYGHTES